MKNRIIPLATFLIGFTAMSTQIVVLRQLIVVFYGNEISLGLMLAAWLFWGALGSWLFGRLGDRWGNLTVIFSLCQIALAVNLTAEVSLIRFSRSILHILPGELIGFLPMVLFSFSVLSLICIILGFLFALACRIYPVPARSGGASPHAGGARGIGTVYIVEALGAVCGGYLVSFFLIRYFDALYIMCFLALVNLACAFFLSAGLKHGRAGLAIRALSAMLFLALSLSLLSGQAKTLKDFSLHKQWKEFKLLAVKDSLYSNLAVTQQGEQFSFFSNGLYLFSVPDEAGSEEAAHFALLQTPAASQRVLLIGAGIGGIAGEILKHPVSALDYIELDPELVALAETFLPREQLLFLNDPRVKVFHQDGRLFIRQARRLRQGPYESVIVHLGDPATAQLNRYYTLEFFRQVAAILGDKGVFSFSLTAAENFLSDEQQQFLASIYRTLKKVFKEIKVIPGGTAYFLATNTPGLLTDDPGELTQRLAERGIATKFVRDYYLFAQLAPDRIAYLEGKIQRQERAQVNTDLRPISYYYDMVLWSTYFAEPWRSLFARIDVKKLWAFFGCVYLAILSWGLKRRRTNSRSAPVLLAVYTTGLTELSFQVIILLAFQIIYGYLYYKIGFILSSFMIGLAGGAYIMTKNLDRLNDAYRTFTKTQIAICVYPLILPLVFSGLSRSGAAAAWDWAGSNIVFTFLPVISGFIGGLQFPLANKIILSESQDIGRVSGITYGMDLFGSCLGALLVSAFLIPLLGITQTCLAVALLNTTVLVFLFLKGR